MRVSCIEAVGVMSVVFLAIVQIVSARDVAYAGVHGSDDQERLQVS